jgi:hypothetical protein
MPYSIVMTRAIASSIPNIQSNSRIKTSENGVRYHWCDMMGSTTQVSCFTYIGK